MPESISQRNKKSAPVNSDALLLASVLKTAEIGRLIRDTLLALIEDWSKKGRLRGFFARGLAWLVRLVFSFVTKPEARSLAEVMKQPEEAGWAIDALPRFTNKALALSQSAMKSAKKERKPPPEAIDPALLAASLTTCLQSVNASSAKKASESGASGVEAFIENLDFGELKEFVDTMSKTAMDASEALAKSLYRYPAKTLCLASIGPTLLNTSAHCSATLLKTLNRLAPDLISDIALSLVREIDGRSFGRLANESIELARKFHTGQLLIGEQGKPKAIEDFGALYERFLDTLDVQSYLKVRRMMAENRLHWEEKSNAILEAHQALVLESVGEPISAFGANWFRTARKLDLLEDALRDDEMAMRINAEINALDPQEMGESLSRLLLLYLRFHETHPEAFARFMKQVVSSIDESAFEDFFALILPNLMEALKPIAPSIAPSLISAMAEFVNEATALERAAMGAALKEFCNAMKCEETMV